METWARETTMFSRPTQPIRAALLAGLMALPFGCRTTPDQGQSLVFFPNPPAAPRVQFLMSASGADDVEPKSDWFEEFILGD